MSCSGRGSEGRAPLKRHDKHTSIAQCVEDPLEVRRVLHETVFGLAALGHLFAGGLHELRRDASWARDPDIIHRVLEVGGHADSGQA